MTVREELGIRLRLIEDCSALVPESDRRPSTRKFSMLLDLYRQDTLRRIAGRTPNLSELADLTLGLRLVDDLLDPFAERREQMTGWFFGCQPKNQTQMLYAMIFGAGVTLSESMALLEQRWVN